MVDRLQRVVAEIDSLPDEALDIDDEAGVITVDYAKVRGWQEESRRRVRTVRVSDRIVVKPPWDEHVSREGDVVLEIDPGAVFGSGLHESTRLCLRALEKHLKPGCTAVDFGAGSGVLAIAAAKLGASRVIAIEADSEAVDVAASNVRANDVAGVVTVLRADNPEAAGARSDVVTANVTAAAIAAYSADLAGIIKLGGTLIVSGITLVQHGDVDTALRQVGLAPMERLAEGEWVCGIYTKEVEDNGRTQDTGTT